MKISDEVFPNVESEEVSDVAHMQEIMLERNCQENFDRSSVLPHVMPIPTWSLDQVWSTVWGKIGTKLTGKRDLFVHPQLKSLSDSRTLCSKCAKFTISSL